MVDFWMDHISPYLIGAAWFIGECVPILVLILFRHRLGAFNTASVLLAYGALVLLYEHAGFTITYTLGGLPQEGYVAPAHARVHSFMAAVYATIGMVGFLTLVSTMLRMGSRLAWLMLLVALVIGGSVEVVVNGPAGLLFQHTSPPNPIPAANALWAYLVAWAAALLISRPAVFGARPRVAVTAES